jgi:hypothetical protein
MSQEGSFWLASASGHWLDEREQQVVFSEIFSAVKEVGGNFSCSGRSPFKGNGFPF